MASPLKLVLPTTQAVKPLKAVKDEQYPLKGKK